MSIEVQNIWLTGWMLSCGLHIVSIYKLINYVRRLKRMRVIKSPLIWNRITCIRLKYV
jgi:hypothetical protein